MDNQAAIYQVQSEESSYKTKHVDIKHKFVKDAYKKGTILPVYVTTTEMKADILTKALATPIFCNLREMIGIKPDFETGSTQRGGVLKKE